MAYTTVPKSTDYFNTKLYTGTGSSQVITGIGFQPDFIWTKTRNEAEIHCLNTTVQGINSYLRSNATDQLETAGSNITAQSSDGYTVGTEDRFNQSSNTFVSWNWKANGAGASNTEGSINTTKTSANATSGFSIVTWSGNSGSLGHGLGQKPAMLIIKSTGATGGWYVTHKSLSAEMQDNYMFLNDTSANTTNNNIWGGEPTSTTFSVGSGLIADTTHVAYCFADVQGFSKFGSYVGNGNADGAFVYTGFKPAFVLIKKATGSADSWFINDNKRSLSGGFNTNSYYMRPNENSAEGTASSLAIDILSNGFKIRNSDTAYNANNSTYIYMAFAEEPLVSTNGQPATAR